MDLSNNPRRLAKSAQAPAWAPGQSAAAVEVACCPSCGSLSVRHKGRGGGGKRLAVYWGCCKCDHHWKGLRPGVGRAVVIL